MNVVEQMKKVSISSLILYMGEERCSKWEEVNPTFGGRRIGEGRVGQGGRKEMGGGTNLRS